MPFRQSRIIIVVAALGLIGLPFSHAANFTKERSVKPFTTDPKPGDYLWHPQVSSAGPVVVLVSLPDQVMYVYRNGVRIGRSTVSTGKRIERSISRPAFLTSTEHSLLPCDPRDGGRSYVESGN